MAASVIEDEILMIENGGEMPEVTLHSCLYFLRQDPEGPRITLGQHDLRRLKLAVVEGYRKIIMRDLTPENRGKGHYRGVARCIINVQRLRRYCLKEGFDIAPVEREVCDRLGVLLMAEYTEVRHNKRQSSINCSVAELEEFLSQIGFDDSPIRSGWKKLLG